MPRDTRSFRSLLPCAIVPLAAVAVFGAALLAHADSHEAPAEVDPNIKYRQKLMSAVGANMGAVADIMKYQLDLPGHVVSHAAQMAQSAQLVAAAFRTQAMDGPTDAKPEIWQEWQHFEEDIVEFEKTARDLERAATKGDPAGVGAAMKALGKSCSGCHKEFRKPKEESYKNQ